MNSELVPYIKVLSTNHGSCTCLLIKESEQYYNNKSIQTRDLSVQNRKQSQLKLRPLPRTDQNLVRPQLAKPAHFVVS